VPQYASRVQWLDGLPRNFSGVVVANEVADALPVERFVRNAHGVEQIRVAARGDEFVFCRDRAPEWLAGCVEGIEASIGHRLPDAYVSELSPGLPGWIGDIAACLERGFVFLFDYGVSRREYYADDRNDGWLRCHFRHRVHQQPLQHPGIQDISAWVDFTAAADGAVAAGLEVAGFVTQSRFLLDGGLGDELPDFASADTKAQIELSRQVKLLTLPGEMGEHFKCMGLSLGIARTPDAFVAGDRSHAL
jgi:SAM-dependent MidA family methyltransferase